jgi:hypothetical protein
VDLPDAEEESLALVDAKVLEEEQKLRDERKKAEEASKTEVRQLARSRHRRDGFPFALASTWATSPAVSVPTRRDATARRGERAMRPNRPAFKTPRRFRRDARVPGARARAARRADPQPQISVASTRAVPSRRVRFGATRHLRKSLFARRLFFFSVASKHAASSVDGAVLLPPSTRDA